MLCICELIVNRNIRGYFGLLMAVFFFIVEGFIVSSIKNYSSMELYLRLRAVQKQLGHGIEYSEVREPPSKAINVVRALRDGSWKLIPTNLLVNNDIIQAGEGENIFVSCKSVSLPQIVGSFYEVLETPLKRQLEFITKFNPQDLNSEFQPIFTSVLNFVLLVLLFISTASICFPSSKLISSFPMIPLTEGALLIFVLSSKLWSLLYVAYGNARIISLSEVLKKSKTPYIEAEDVDEFDEEAPPPTKDIYLNPRDIWSKVFDSFGGKLSECLFWSLDLSNCFSTVTVLSFLDREGPIANPFPIPLELAFPSPTKEDDITFGEFLLDPNNPTVVRTNFVEPLITDSYIRAFGLAMMLSSSCSVHQGQFRREWHVRFPWNTYPGKKLDPVFRTCTCFVAREMGFQARVATKYRKVLDFWILRDVGISVSLKPIEYQGLFSRIVSDPDLNNLFMFSIGDLTSSVSLCNYTWNDREILRMSDGLRKRMINLDDKLASSDLQCIGITFKPVLQKAESLVNFKDNDIVIDYKAVADPNNKSDITNLARNQIFLGSLISGYVPKEDMQELIDDLENSGIRFVYFSPYSESITKAFGDRLGLETDWNSCIILSKSSDKKSCDATDASSDFTDPKSKIPRGVQNIRPHLQNVDDIPLHISLFAECDPSSVSDMLKIYKEYGESVVCVGSTLNWSNSEVFSSAKACIGMEPSNIRNSSLKPGPIQSLHLSATITSLVTPLVLPFDCSPYVLTEIIREARCLYQGHKASSFYRFTMSIVILLVSLFMDCKVHFLLALTIILNSFSFLATPYEPGILKLMPKRPSSPNELKDISLMALLRGSLSSMLIGLALRFTNRFHSLMTIILFSSISSTFMHEYLSVIQFGVINNTNTFWILINCLVIFISGLTNIIFEAYDYIELLHFIFVMFLSLMLAILVNETIKWRVKVETEKSEKRAKLQFNTKLGMHSPV